jgi:hypothetical protein
LSLTLCQNIDLRISGKSEYYTGGRESKRRLGNTDRQNFVVVIINGDLYIDRMIIFNWILSE